MRLRARPWQVTVAAVVVLIAAVGLYLLTRRDAVEVKLEALRAAGHPTSMTRWVQQHRPPRGAENSADIYGLAFDFVEWADEDANVSILGWRRLPDRGAPWSEPMLRDVSQCLADNKTSLSLLHRAAGIEHCQHKWEHVSSSPDFMGVWGCAGLLGLEALYCAQTGDTRAAVDSIKAGLRLSDSLRSEPGELVYLDRMNCLSFSLGALDRGFSVAAFTDEQLRELDAAVAQAAAKLDLAEMIAGERCLMIEMYRDPRLSRTIVGRGRFLKLPRAKKAGFLDTLDYMADCIEAAKLPPTQRLARFRELDDTLRERSFWHVVVKRAQQELSESVESDLGMRAYLDSARTALAIERYRLATGDVPGELEQLVPDYLDAVPIDPFDGQPIRYRRTEPGYILYSVLADGQDNGGRAHDRDNPDTPHDWPFIVTR